MYKKSIFIIILLKSIFIVTDSQETYNETTIPSAQSSTNIITNTLTIIASNAQLSTVLTATTTSNDTPSTTAASSSPTMTTTAIRSSTNNPSTTTASSTTTDATTASSTPNTTTTNTMSTTNSPSTTTAGSTTTATITTPNTTTTASSTTTDAATASSTPNITTTASSTTTATATASFAPNTTTTASSATTATASVISAPNTTTTNTMSTTNSPSTTTAGSTTTATITTPNTTTTTASSTPNITTTASSTTTATATASSAPNTTTTTTNTMSTTNYPSTTTAGSTTTATATTSSTPNTTIAASSTTTTTITTPNTTTTTASSTPNTTTITTTNISPSIASNITNSVSSFSANTTTTSFYSTSLSTSYNSNMNMDEVQLLIGFTGNDLTCTTSYRNSSMASVVKNLTVDWYTVGKKDAIFRSKIVFDVNRALYYSSLPSSEWLKYMNEEVFCHLNETESTSVVYYLGLRLNLGTNDYPIFYDNKTHTAPSLVIYEEDLNGKNFTVNSTIPLIAKSSNNTEILIFIGLDVSPLLHLSSDSNCFIKIEKDKRMQDRWTLTPTINLENRILSSLTINIPFEIVIGTGLIDDFKSLVLPTLSVLYVPSIRSYATTGQCYNDPHCYTNDFTPFEFQYYDGEYVMYENEELDYRVHMISEPCAYWDWCGRNNCNYCIRNVFVQSIDDFVSFDVKKTPSLSYVDLSSEKKEKVPLVWVDNVAVLPDSTSFKVIQNSYEYQIVSQFGTGLVISKWGTFFQMIPSKLDKNKVFGVLGNYNGRSDDDFRVTKRGMVASTSEFFDVYNVSKHSLPQFSKGEYYNRSVERVRYCTCHRVSEANYEKQCQNGATEIPHREVSRRKRRDIVNQINPADLSYVFNFKIEEKEQEMSNTSSCDRVLRHNQMMIKCDQLGIIQLEKLVQDCDFDFASTKMDVWADYYLKSRKGWCQDVLQNDGKFFVATPQANGQLKYTQSAIINELCLNDCSGQGNCIDGKCVCTVNYTGVDCSVNLKSAPKLLSTLFEENICDIQHYKCQLISLYASGLATKVKVKYSYRVSKGSSVNTNFVDSLSITENIIAAYLPEYSLTVVNKTTTVSTKTYTLRVTNSDESIVSNALDYTIYNSKCHLRYYRTFVLKNNTCDIDGVCYIDGETKSNDTTYKCNPKVDGFTWTRITAINYNTGNKIAANSLAFLLFLPMLMY